MFRDKVYKNEEALKKNEKITKYMKFSSTLTCCLFLIVCSAEILCYLKVCGIELSLS